MLPAGAKLGINIAPTHLHGETFKDDIHHLQTSLPANHFQMVLEITERDMLNQHEATKLLNGFIPQVLKLPLMILAPVIAR